MTDQTPGDSVGARYGNTGFSMALGARDPRPRRAAQAALTDAEKGALEKRDDLGRDTIDMDGFEQELLKRGFVKDGL